MRTRIEIANANRELLHQLGFYKYGSYCYEEDIIYLYLEADENEIITTLNHEYLHAIISKIINGETCKRFDRIFWNFKKGKLREMDEYGVPL